MEAGRQKAIEQTQKSLERLQGFDPALLPRIEELESAVNFKDAVGPAARLIDLYRQLPVKVPTFVLPNLQSQALPGQHCWIKVTDEPSDR